MGQGDAPLWLGSMAKSGSDDGRYDTVLRLGKGQL